MLKFISVLLHLRYATSTSLGKPVVNGDFSITIAVVIRYVGIDVIAVLLSPSSRIAAFHMYT